METEENLQAIIFDVDGTLYSPIPEVDEQLYNYWVGRIMEFKKLSRPEAENTFRSLKSQYKSSTRVLEVLGLGNSFTIIKHAEKFLTRLFREHLKRDRKLIQLIKKLHTQYALYTLRNGTKVGTRAVLSRLGFVNSRPSHVKGYGPFDDILPTAELGFTKPHTLVFENALKQLKLKPSQVIMVGDRIEVDLAPAHKMGIKTVWVSWGKEKPAMLDGVDAVVETIYDMKELI